MQPSPAGSPAASVPPVVVTVRPVPRVVTTVLGGTVLVGLVWAVVDAVTHGASYPWRHSGLGTTGQTVGWVVVALVGATLVVGLVASWTLRIEVSPAGARVRLLRRWRDCPLARMERLRWKAASRTTAPRPAAIRVVLRDASGRRRSFNLAFGLTNAVDALPAVVGWARERPELLQDPLTRAAFRELAAFA